MSKKEVVPVNSLFDSKILKTSLVKEMQESYLDYAMSVIVSRALPDVRDGLKPVHRRILVAMNDLGLGHTAHYRKCAKICGDVSGNYHPHGESAVYPTLARMAQDFSLRYPLVWGQGNFGSMDGDPPAAMRYTEARMHALAEEILSDLKRDTVNFRPNYDNTNEEPVVLPAKVPNLLINGTLGIAVGMASNIAPHNLTEICDATIHLINDPSSTVEDLMQYVRGPDFPTGGIIFNKEDIKQIYATGKGGIVVRGRAEIEEAKTGGFKIIITEVPYQVVKSTLLQKMAELVREKKIEGIKDIRDESTSAGVRVVIDLKKDAYPKKILNQLYKMTQLQNSFHVNMLALVDGIYPRVLTLKMILEEYIKHRQVVVRRRTAFDLAKAQDRAHILEGLMIALDKIDAVIKTIKQSKDKEEAKKNLISKFKLSERQSIAILEMRLQSLASLERLKIETELKEKKQLIKDLEYILKTPKKILEIIRNELEELKEKYGDDRRTKIVSGAVEKFAAEDLIPDEKVIIIVTRDGYIKRLPPDTFKAQGRGGKGIIGLAAKEEDIVEHFFSTNTHAELLFFTTAGKVFRLKAYDVPQSSRTAKGQALVNFLQLGPNESVSSILSLADLSVFKYLTMVTKSGVAKRVELESFKNIRASGLIAIKLKGNDRLEWVKPSSGSDEVMIVSSKGQSIRFKENKLRAMGRNSSGVRGMRLKSNDYVVGMDIITKEQKEKDLEVLVVTENGFGKRTELSQYKLQGRGGSGIKTVNLTKKTGALVSGRVVNKVEMKDNDLIIISEKGQVIRLAFASVNISGRATQGVHLMRFKIENDKVANVTFV